MAADPLDQIAELCRLQPEGVLDKIAAVLGMDKVEAQRHELSGEVRRLRALINTPHTADYFEAVRLEAAHQQERWG
ncbi:MAG TPA: hypothetical protein VEB23_08240, partial [Ramlibacter sp.]|nr:hypothetical protein [Ramlibacter sp.]